MKTDILLMNGLPAPYRRDLRGKDLWHELSLVLQKMEPGDVLRVSVEFCLRAGKDFVIPEFPWHGVAWTDVEKNELCIQRDA